MLTRRTFAFSAAASATGCNASTPDVQAPSRWRNGPDAPYAVQEIYPALHRGAIWIAGGFAPWTALGATRRVIALDVARNAWSEGPSLPEPSHHVHLASLNHELYAVGGYLGGDNRRRWICTPRVLKLEGDRWIEAPPLPKPIAEGVPLVLNGRIHLISGRSPAGADNSEWDHQADIGDHFVLAAGAAQWDRAEPVPIPRNSAAGAVRDGVLHIISGRTVASGQTGAHHTYDPRTGHWSEGAPFPEPRGGLAAAELNGDIIAGGGEIFEPGSVGDALYRLDRAGAWSRFETLPTPRHGYGMINAGGALYMLGGAERPSGDGTLASVDVLR
ncbi:MAG: Kelch repeat-containing protein [Caulobacteraceae bacterium]